MHVPVMFALGEFLTSSLLISFTAAVAGVACYILARRFAKRQTADGRRIARRFLFALFVCILLALLSPLIAQTLHLP